MSSTTRTVRSAIEIVNDTVERLRLEYRHRGHQENVSASAQVGLFGNLSGAEVAVEQRIEVGKNGEYVSVRHAIAVICAGFGCTEPLIETTRNLIFDCDHGDITEQGRLAARQQAQAHAEKCRAMPRPTN
ncbi:hypothetical protein [Streptomyces sp. NPDC058155]|uniref:hypothetical protein n=1 Tax=Streptomyces sp. NPDC058155 TaxID=3346359 RepID=UPI0036E1E1F2